MKKRGGWQPAVDGSAVTNDCFVLDGGEDEEEAEGGNDEMMDADSINGSL